MKRLNRWLGVVGMGMVAGAMLVVQACANRISQHEMDARTAARQNGTADSRWTSGEPIGLSKDSNGLSTMLNGGSQPTGNDGLRRFGDLSLETRDVPYLDLQRSLGASQGGGGGGQSPFRSGRADWSDTILEHGSARSNAQDHDEAWGFTNSRNRPNATGDVSVHGNVTTRQKVLLSHVREIERLQAEARAARPEVVLAPGEELWVIQRVKPRFVAPMDDTPGCGSLMTKREEGGNWREVPVPLAHTSVKARVDGYVSSVTVQQKFHNPFDSKIEALYVFPLPEDAAVNDFLMTVGTRTIRGVIREREEAEKIYERARRAGHVASLMTQDRPNIFTQAVANIEPGKEIDIDVTYLHCLPYRDGAFEFVFPMVVGPRFNPPSMVREGTGVSAVAYGSGPAAERRATQQTEIQYLRPMQRSGADISVAVEINAGVSIESLESPSHAITVAHDRASPTFAKVSLDASSKDNTIPNKDFVLRYRVAGSATKSAMLTQAAGKENGYFSMLLVPPSDLSYIARGPVEVVFLIDCSGSMDGEPLEQAKAAARHALSRLDPDDTFQIINFSDAASQLGGEPLEASRRNLERGLSYLDSLKAGGGTMMMNGVRAALGYRNDPQRTRFVCFLTDGFIGNDAEVLGLVREKLGQSRIMSVGIGSSPNRYLLEGLGRLGRGCAAFLNPGDKPEEIMEVFLDRVAHAALTDVSIDWAGLQVEDVYPKRLPDLYVGRPVMITGRYSGTARGPVKVKGRAGRGGRERIETALAVTGVELGERTEGKSGLASIWARKKIEELSDQATSEDGARVQRAIRTTALEHGLMSAYTAFIAVDSMTKTAGAFGTTVGVPVPVPAGVRYDTTVTEAGSRR